ncbi:MAG: leucyl aminopeptidase [Myxococcales bacterium]|nr:leucyl aminopeptidase [Myxococcales bacterium]
MAALRPMKITLSKDSLTAVAVDLLVVCVGGAKPAQDPNVKMLDAALDGMLIRYMKDQDFKAKAGSRLTVPGAGGIGAKRVLVLGTKSGALSPADCKSLAVRAARAGMERASLALVAPGAGPEALAAIAEGLVSGSYRYVEYLTAERRPKRALARVTVLVPRVSASDRRAVAQGVSLGECVNFARDLVNCPPNDLTATELAERARGAARKHGVRCQVYDRRGIERLNMPLLLAVNRGSAEEPRFVHMVYKPKGRGKVRRVVFVGKGLTFDSGGLCIKPGASMADMKCDMAGAAVTIATVIAAARLELPVEVHGVVGSTDNMTGGAAYRPGDVFPSRDGKTVEIVNTDAEGRLVLADALSYARELEPDYLVDHATLTGACMVALGNYRAALFATDDKLKTRYEKAAEAAGEAFWNLPLDPDLRDSLKSPIADLKHVGSRFGGTITAALFLKEFVGKAKWAHLDIAGPAFLEGAHGNMPKGGTGFGVATAVHFLRGL